jgi:hypothetical protein
VIPTGGKPCCTTSAKKETNKQRKPSSDFIFVIGKDDGELSERLFGRMSSFILLSRFYLFFIFMGHNAVIDDELTRTHTWDFPWLVSADIRAVTLSPRRCVGRERH